MILQPPSCPVFEELSKSPALKSTAQKQLHLNFFAESTLECAAANSSCNRSRSPDSLLCTWDKKSQHILIFWVLTIIGNRVKLITNAWFHVPFWYGNIYLPEILEWWWWGGGVIKRWPTFLHFLIFRYNHRKMEYCHSTQKRSKNGVIRP